MSPRKIVQKALEKGLNLIAITDHNSYQNTYYAAKIAADYGVKFLFGIEVQTAEEVHLLGLFDSYEDVMSFGKIIYNNLPNVPNNPDYFGDQVVVNEEDEIVQIEPRLLLNSATLSLSEVVNLISMHHGLSILSHVNANQFSVISQLGFIPEDLAFDAIEVTCDSEQETVSGIEGIQKHPVVTFSDSHYPSDIGRGYTVFFVEEPTVSEIKKALKGEEGRYYEVFGEKGRIV